MDLHFFTFLSQWMLSFGFKPHRYELTASRASEQWLGLPPLPVVRAPRVLTRRCLTWTVKYPCLFRSRQNRTLIYSCVICALSPPVLSSLIWHFIRGKPLSSSTASSAPVAADVSDTYWLNRGAKPKGPVSSTPQKVDQWTSVVTHKSQRAHQPQHILLSSHRKHSAGK